MTAAGTFAPRALDAADEAEWRRLWTGYLAFYRTSVPEEVYATTFARLVRDEPSMRAMVAAEEGASPGGRLAGLVHTIDHPHCWRIEPVRYLQDLFTDEDVRGQGVARSLIEAVYRSAEAHGISNVYWLTAQDNTTARALYDRIAAVTPFIKYQRPA